MKLRQPPVSHAQSLEPPVPPQSFDLLGMTVCFYVVFGSQEVGPINLFGHLGGHSPPPTLTLLM